MPELTAVLALLALEPRWPDPGSPVNRLADRPGEESAAADVRRVGVPRAGPPAGCQEAAAALYIVLAASGPLDLALARSTANCACPSALGRFGGDDSGGRERWPGCGGGRPGVRASGPALLQGRCQGPRRRRATRPNPRGCRRWSRPDCSTPASRSSPAWPAWPASTATCATTRTSSPPPPFSARWPWRLPVGGGSLAPFLPWSPSALPRCPCSGSRSRPGS